MIHMNRQCTPRSHHTFRNLSHASRCIDQRRRLTDDSSDCKDHSGKNSRNSRREHNAKYCTKLSRSKSEAAFSVRIRNRLKRFFRRSHNKRKDHNRQCKRSCQNRKSPVQRIYEKQHSEQSVYNRRNSRKRLCCQTDHFYEFISFSRVFHKKDCWKNTERNCDQKRKYRHYDRIDKRRNNGSIFRSIIPFKKRKLNMRYSVDQNICDQKQQYRKRKQRS